LHQLDVPQGHRVLEIGAGTGYNAALLAHLVGHSGQVVTVDITRMSSSQPGSIWTALGSSKSRSSAVTAVLVIWLALPMIGLSSPLAPGTSPRRGGSSYPSVVALSCSWRFAGRRRSARSPSIGWTIILRMPRFGRVVSCCSVEPSLVLSSRFHGGMHPVCCSCTNTLRAGGSG
jgi:Protein-L-isoaspartate(D-aspartate) O-methyltransferase (PCMT)